jgi:osmoprotectant transport system ATP-binding protein
MLTARYCTAVVTDDSGAYTGVVDMDTINEAIRGMRTGERSAARDRLEAQAEPAP